ncbi:MAG: TfoX/Sxy family protein [Bacilli bacterium]|nr:TfoX/Sxy family protein [Bacilli bacterium]
MASTKDYRDYILEQLSILDDVTCKPMMGEYLLYFDGILFGGIYDDRLLVKKVDNNKKYNMKEVIPYQNAKPMYYVEDIDNIDLIKDIVIDTYEGLKEKQYE